MVCGSARTRRSAARMPARLEHTDATQGSISATVASSEATSPVQCSSGHGSLRAMFLTLGAGNVRYKIVHCKPLS